MRHMSTKVMMVLAGIFFLPGVASAQVQILAQRCDSDALDPIQAATRLEWMRRCALLKAAPTQYDTGAPASNGGTLQEYVESGSSGNWTGVNMYTPQSYSNEINSSYISALYLNGPTTQGVDGYGFYSWWRDAYRKKPRPSYPIYGSQYDVNSASNLPLYPHPALATCSLYLDRNGTQPATGYSFYLNGLCESSSLSSGVAIGSLSGSQGSLMYYTLAVPPGATNLVIETSGGSGDADLYVRYGAPPDTANYDCRPYLSTNNEKCVFSAPAAGTWHVMLRGYLGYSGATLKGTVNQLTDGVATPALSGAQASEQRWILEVPAGKSQVTFTLAGLSGNTGDADLYVKYGTAATTSVFDCRPYTSGNSEVCTFNAPSAGTWHVMVRGWSAYTGVTVTGDYN